MLSDLGLKLLIEGAQAGVREAQFLVGECFQRGLGTSVDLKEAVRWYRLAAAQSLADAQHNLGNCYCQGRGVPHPN